MSKEVKVIEVKHARMFSKSISYGGLLLFIAITITSFIFQGLAAAPWFLSTVLFYMLMGERWYLSQTQDTLMGVLVHAYRRAVISYNYLYSATQDDALTDEEKVKEIKLFLRENREPVAVMTTSLNEIDIETEVFTKEKTNV